MNGARTRWFGLALLVLSGTGVARGQFTETAGTVAPGRWLFEADLVNHGRDKADGVDYRSTALGYLQWTRGLNVRGDVQTAVQVFQQEKLTFPDGTDSQHSFEAERCADLYLRSKWRLFGDGQTGWTVSLLPLLCLPTEADEDGHRFVNLGVIVPISRPLGPDWWMDAQVQLDGQKSAGASRDWTWLVSANLQRTWTERWGTYVEVVASFWDRQWSNAAVSGGLGVTCALPGGLGWDAAFYRGLTEEAMDWELALRVYWEI